MSTHRGTSAITAFEATALDGDEGRDSAAAGAAGRTQSPPPTYQIYLIDSYYL